MNAGTRWMFSVLAVVGLSGCGREQTGTEAGQTGSRAESGPEFVRVTLGGDEFVLEVARDELSHERGLGGRSSLGEREGMLFVFPDAQARLFVMKDCVIALDLIYLDAGFAVVSTHEMAPEADRGAHERAGVPEEDAAYEARLQGYMSGGDARYAIEVGAGTVARTGLRAGDVVVMERGVE